MPEGDAHWPMDPVVGIVVSRYNRAVTGRLLDGAMARLEAHGLASGNVVVAWVDGSFEIPAVAAALARSGAKCIVALGCIIKGETRHDDILGRSVTDALMWISMRVRTPSGIGVPVGLGVLTVETPEQALERAGGTSGELAMNKGAHALDAAVRSMKLLREVPSAVGRERERAQGDARERVTALLHDQPMKPFDPAQLARQRGALVLGDPDASAPDKARGLA